MNVTRPEKIVVLGFLSHFPVAGVAWQTVHYLLGLQRLGYDVYYVEAHGCTPSKLMQSPGDDGARLAAAYIGSIMDRFGLGDRWVYHARYPESRYFGMNEFRLRELFKSAALLINLHGSHVPNAELTATSRLVYLGTDPVDVEVDLFNGRQETSDYLAPHCAFFTYGENLGRPDCLVPVPRAFQFRTTRQPVVMDLWERHEFGNATTFTTIGNWRQACRQVTLNGEVYKWSKHFEFRKFSSLPRRVLQPFELALSSYEDTDRQLLEANGWLVRPALEISRNMDAYRRYICQSRGEFTVAKDQNVRLRSGWFSDRAATYLAAGRPVLNQDTGFSNILPTGEGLFAFATLDEAIAAIELINADYERHRRAAWRVAREYFSHEIVLTQLLRDCGVHRRSSSPQSGLDGAALPSGLSVLPVSRWPTRLAEDTIRCAEGLPVPVARFHETGTGGRASIIIVTHGGLTYTKMCVASLLSDWRPDDELIVVDNASADGTPDFLRQLARRNSFVRLELNQGNRGFAVANRQGIELATGNVLILLNNDTIVSRGWRDRLLGWLNNAAIGMVGPTTNRTCNEAQIDVPYATYGELEQFAAERGDRFQGKAGDIPMLALFCAALRRETYERIGPLDERFEIGMFEDDDYARRIRALGLRIICAEDVFVHHFGQASLGELCSTGEYDRLLEGNRRRFEEKWGVTWKPHARRITPEYRQLRARIRQSASHHLPPGARVMVVSKGDDELLKLGEANGWHFPQAKDGNYANLYPADSAEAISQLETLRAKGAEFLLIPKPAFWWLKFYDGFRVHLEVRYRSVVYDAETCMIFHLGGANA